ncbi:undecaprenyl-diphosphate phosphatase [Candidatus Nanogingivalis gingivitcus]|jgi:undecaprenyl-diphosphatase|uniref:Undecaprenyl-diphosphatase n=1 Tax=Candidatus Nanogingivalis gingivitcus TaxID=2171992 RepID=A0ABY0FJP8_9BACT|nr:undecaprenyl-diphosphate phosphatase [Candidatus Nanogingivalis gingivitcus]RYC72514.1 Undecaprenyl-diphosphatase [Candidatus Nanogingivalis gingivitcus]
MDIITVFKVAIVAIIEGITEWLPISSSSHIMLFDKIVGLNFTNEFKEVFLVVIQLGAILAIIVTYFNLLNPISEKKSYKERKETWELWGKILVASIPAGILGAILNKTIDSKLENFIVISTTLILYGAIFILLEKFIFNKNKKAKVQKINEISYTDALKIGGFQVLSLIPGTSRSGSTILGGVLSGFSRSVATEFSFLIAIPVMFGASALKILKYGLHFSEVELFYMALATVIAFVVSMAVVRRIIAYLKKHSFEIFGWYRILLGMLIILCFILR